MNALDAMVSNPLTLKPTDTIECAAEYIMEKRYRSLPVVDDNHCYVGMFGVNCLLKQMMPQAVFLPQGLDNIDFMHESFEDLSIRFNEMKDQPISICMSQDVKSVTPDTPLQKILLQLYKTRDSIPVVEEGSCKLLGMISYWDIGKKTLAATINKDA